LLTLSGTPQDDYELDVVFRISEEKKKIMFSRSEVRGVYGLLQLDAEADSRVRGRRAFSKCSTACATVCR
jgi:hypothetical protein